MNRYHRPMARQEEKGFGKQANAKGNALPNLKAATGAFDTRVQNPNRLPAGKPISDKVKGMTDGYTLRRAEGTPAQRITNEIRKKTKRLK